MSCYHPIKGYRTTTGVVFNELSRYDILGDIELPCGRCQGCRLRRRLDWTIRSMHEAQMHSQNCFITLTYARDKLPPNGSLCKEDFQKFLKRLRKKRGSARYYMCGEYGPENGRPHYHANLFGVDFRNRTPEGKSESGQYYYSDPELTQLWGHGYATVQDLTKETAAYTPGYIMKKRLGVDAELGYQIINEKGETIQLEPEYSHMSLKPGIGETWFKKYGRDIFPHDHAILEGQELQTPRYYDKLYARIKDNGTQPDHIAQARIDRAKQAAHEQTDERRAVREQVAIARIRNQLRNNIK